MSTHPLIHEPTREEKVNPNKTDVHPVNLATGPEANKTGTTAQTNPTIVTPPSHGNPPLTSANQPATTGNLPTNAHPQAAGPHPPIDATHKKEEIISMPDNHTTPGYSTDRLKRLERSHLSDLTNMLSHSYSSADSFIVLPSTEEEDPTAHKHQATDSSENTLAKDLKKDQNQLDKLTKRRDYIFKKIARALIKRDAAWGLFDESNTNILASAIFIPPIRNPTQHNNQLRLEDPNVDEGRPSHYVPLAKLFTKKNPKQLLLLGPSLIKRIRLELRLFDTAMTVHERPDVGFLYFFGDLNLAQNIHDKNVPAAQSLTQHRNPTSTLENKTQIGSQNVNLMLTELSRRYPMIVTAERYRDHKRFLMLLQNGFQEIDKVQGFRQRYAEGEAHVIAPGIGSKGVHGQEGPDQVYESCFITLAKGLYPSLKNVENDVRGIVPQKETCGVISDPTTMIPPAHIAHS